MKRILLEECIPRPLARYLPNCYVRTVPQMGWASIANGALLKVAEAEFEGIRYQETLPTTTLGVIVLRARSNRLEDLLPIVQSILTELATIRSGDLVQLAAPTSSH